MKIHAGIDKVTGLPHSVVMNAANLQDLTPAAHLPGDNAQVIGEADAPATEEAELTKKAEAAAATPKVAREQAIETAEQPGLEPPDLEPLAADAMPGRELARKADSAPTRKTQHNFTYPVSHLMQPGGAYLQSNNCQLAVDSDHQVIVAVGGSNQPPDVEHLEPMLQQIASSARALPAVMTLDA